MDLHWSLVVVPLWIGALALGGTGIAVLFRQYPWVRVAGLSMILVATVPVFLVVKLGRDTNENPRVHDTDIIATWVATGFFSRDRMLTLNRDGRFELNTGEVVRGRWTRQDYGLWLQPDGGKLEYWRVVLEDDAYRLVRNWCGPDEACDKAEVRFRRAPHQATLAR